jgi:hypothetical protein
MQGKVFSGVVCASLLMIVTLSGSVSATQYNIGDVILDLTQNGATSDVTVVDFNWDQSSTINLVLDCEFDDNNFAHDYFFNAYILVTHEDAFGNFKGSYDDHWTNPSNPSSDNSAMNPIGRYLYGTLSVTFGAAMTGDHLYIHVVADIVNYDENPDVWGHDQHWLNKTL